MELNKKEVSSENIKKEEKKKYNGFFSFYKKEGRTILRIERPSPSPFLWIFLIFLIVFLVSIDKGYVNIGKIKEQVIKNSDIPKSGIKFVNLTEQFDTLKNDWIRFEESDNLEEDNKNTDKIKSGISSSGVKKNNIYVIDYNGTTMAKEEKYFTKKINSILLNSKENDKVIINMDSGGGIVTGYGLVSAQIERLKAKKIYVIVTVDQLAASGGYMAAAVADEIVAAPFSMVGSIGVVANVLIYEDLLKKVGVQSNVYTAGESKRSVVPTKIPTKEEEKKLNKKLASIHNSFKNHILKYRPNVDVKKVFTGEVFLATEGLKLGLVDKIKTSDELLMDFYLEGDNNIIKLEALVDSDGSNNNIFVNAFSERVVDFISSNRILYQ